jgi:hypothetical protein
LVPFSLAQTLHILNLHNTWSIKNVVFWDVYAVWFL